MIASGFTVFGGRTRLPLIALHGPHDLVDRGPSLPDVPVDGWSDPGAAAGNLPWTPAIGRATAHLYERVKAVIPPVEWPLMAPYVHAINTLKKQRRAVILAHQYQSPEIFHCVADIGGDSLQLATAATKVDADIVVQCGVRFMAETSKILNPGRTVLIPDARAGCSLASSITGADVRLLREAYPGVPVVAYVNTSAEVKAEADICCTSSNALQVVESLGAPAVIMLPDQYLARYVAEQTDVRIIAWRGSCEVHTRFTGQEIRAYRDADPTLQVIAHPECPPDVLAEADFVGSTAQMITWARNTRATRVAMVTECSMADNVRAELPDLELIQPCNFCPHMKRITLANILDSLIHLREPIMLDADVMARARLPIERMIGLAQ